MFSVYSDSPEKTEIIASIIADNIKSPKTIAMFGDLGAGKTAFTRGFVNKLNIKAEVHSPTFAIVNEYRDANGCVYHFDMYRINTWDELYSTGYFEYLEEDAYIIIEWSENIENALPNDCIKICITKEGDTLRKLTIDGCDEIENIIP